MGTSRHHSFAADDGNPSLDDAIASVRAIDTRGQLEPYWEVNSQGRASLTFIGRWGEDGDYDYGWVAFDVTCQDNPAAALREAARLAVARIADDYGPLIPSATEAQIRSETLIERLEVEAAALREMAGSEAFTIAQRTLFEGLANLLREAASALKATSISSVRRSDEREDPV